MTRDEIVQMAREVGIFMQSHQHQVEPTKLDRFAALIAAAESRKVAEWMLQRSYATGHGDTVEDLLKEMEWQVAERATRAKGKP